MAKTATVTLAGREYTVVELPLRRNAEWRRRLTALATDLTALLETDRNLELSAGNIATIMRKVSRLVLESPDMLVEMLYAYSPEIEADRERLEAEVYDSELLTAFTEVLKLAYPFGSLLISLVSLSSGSKSAPTGPS